MTKQDLNDAMLEAALDAADAIMAVYADAFAVAVKDDRSPVTEADTRAEQIIRKRLNAAAPHITLVAEEAHAAGDVPAGGARFFLVDPLDGTREFINRNDQFTVNIALIEDGVPVAGVVYAPATGRLFATDGNGIAFQLQCRVRHDRTQLESAERLPLHCSAAPSGELRAVASRSHRDAATDAYLARHAISHVVSAGSSLKFCLLAAGEADIYPRFGRTMQWDTAAGHAILRAAGGEVYGLDGKPLRYGGPPYENPPFIAWSDARRPVPL